MKLIASSDLHVGKRHEATYSHVSRLEVTIKVLNDMARLCRIFDAKIMVLAGDTFDKAFPDLETLIAIYQALWAIQMQGILVYLMRGNHEIGMHSLLQRNVMRLFDRVCQVVTEPQSIVSDTSIVMLIPWHPNPTLMQRCYEEAALLVRGERRTCVMFSHVGLTEGRVSPSNFSVPQPICSADLHPAVWDAIFLGDYHAHQMITENVCYMGAPIAHTFGDTDIVGPWLIDTDANEYRPIDLMHNTQGYFTEAPNEPRYPRFMRWNWEDPSGFPDFPIDPRDYNEIRLHPVHVDRMAALFPTARTLPSTETTYAAETTIDGVRLKVEDLQSLSGIVNAWLAYKRRDPGPERDALEAIGLELIRG